VERFLNAMAVVGTVFIVLVLIVLLVGAFHLGGLLPVLVLAVYLTWVFYARMQYGYCRRVELLHLLAGAAEDGVPLAPALRAYLKDRPRGSMREFWVASLLFFVLPGYYWIWHRRSHFDRKVEQLARLLEQGTPLFQALQWTPGLASRETVLAAAIGESTGQLPTCLRKAVGHQTAGLWIEFFPQLVYPVFVLLMMASISGFILYYIVPKFKKIFMDFGVDLPTMSLVFLELSDWVVNYFWAFILGGFAAIALGVACVYSPTMSWFFPVLGTLYRRSARSRVLRMLAMLLGTGRTIPEALALLSSLPIGRPTRMRIEAAHQRISQGEPLAEGLLDAGLLTGAMAPFVHAAQRAGNLPWALGELGDTIYNRTIRAIQRVMHVLFPLTVICLGLIVGFFVIAFFMPLIKLITELSG
jgi:type II secretory pathway component PulF